ncbi:MAG: sigma-70 family RNA polymerase sigma factor [Chitinophagaceae bacterium]|nr:sigma-70 family RNA polymerase sigma factor [Anaerolineae bacterium]
MTNHPSPEDIELIQRIKQRDQSALVEIHGRYRNLVYNMAMQVLKNASSAEEITQDIFFQVWRWPEKWDPEKGRFTSWLLTVTRYTAIDRLRRENRQPPLSPHSLDHLAEFLAKKSPFEDSRRDNGRLLRTLIKELPKEQRDIIMLAYFRGMTHTEIAEQTHLPIGTVKSRIRLGLQKLKEAWFEAIEHPSTEPE